MGVQRQAHPSRLTWKGLELNGIDFDIFLAAYLLNPTASNLGMHQLAGAYADIPIQSDEQIYGKGAKRKLPDSAKALYEHIARKARVIYEAKERMEDELEQHGMLGLFYDLELPLSQILGEMETEGIKVDRSKLEKMGVELNERLEELTEENICIGRRCPV